MERCQNSGAGAFQDETRTEETTGSYCEQKCYEPCPPTTTSTATPSAPASKPGSKPTPTGY